MPKQSTNSLQPLMYLIVWLNIETTKEWPRYAQQYNFWNYKNIKSDCVIIVISVYQTFIKDFDKKSKENQENISRKWSWHYNFLWDFENHYKLIKTNNCGL